MKRTIIQITLLIIFLGMYAPITSAMGNELPPDTTAYYDFIAEITGYFRKNNFPMVADPQEILLDTGELQILSGYCTAQESNKVYFLQKMYSVPNEYRNTMRAAYSHYLDLVAQYPLPRQPTHAPSALNDHATNLDIDDGDVWSPSAPSRPYILGEYSPQPVKQFNPLNFHMDATDDEIFITISENGE